MDESLGKLELSEKIKQFDLYKPAYHIHGCAVIISLIFLLVGGGLLYSEFCNKLASNVPLINIILSPLSTFAFSIVYLSYVMIRNFIKSDLIPKNPHLYSPWKKFRSYIFDLLNWLNILVSILYIFTNEWALSGAIWGFLGPVTFVILMTALYHGLNKLSDYTNQKRYGDSMLHINLVKQEEKVVFHSEIILFSENIDKYCKEVSLTLYRINEHIENKVVEKKLVSSYGPIQIPISGRRNIHPIDLLYEDVESIDFVKWGGITYWLAEVEGDDKRYYAIFYPVIEIEKWIH